jgi:UDP-N-acetylmuramoyl-tripeptide--D-alanyl-D-alanine ligase
MTFAAPISQLVELLAAGPVQCPAELLSQTVTDISTDSRQVAPGQLFLALKGEKFDGHQFVAKVLSQGALIAITDHEIADAGPQLVVADTLTAYQKIGRWWRDQFQIPVIAITGSVGKTTTKELIAAVLGTYGKVLKTEANFNNEIGVPKTLLQLGPEHDFAVIEMGMRGLGEIACLSQIARPNIAVITNVGTAHIGRLGSREAIATAKCELLAEMPKSSTAILNADTPLLLTTAAGVWQGQTLTYGLLAGTLRGQLTEQQSLWVEGASFPLPLPGEHNALNFLAALAVAKTLKLDRQPLLKGIAVNLPEGRAKRFSLGNDVIGLDETYNAGPESMAAALRLLRQIPGQRHLAVLGPMRELGDFSVELHQQIGQLVQELKLDNLLILGTDAEANALATGATPLTTQQFSTHADLISYLQNTLLPGDRVLFKASHSVGLAQVVEALQK